MKCDVAIDECASNPCNNGTCIDLVNGYQCVCPPGFTGESCIPLYTNEHQELILLFISGINCGEDIPECGSQPCLNGGSCTEPSPNTFQCSCPPGVTGVYCEMVTYATFNGDSVLQITQRSPSRTKRSISGVTGEVKFSLQTTVFNGIILFATGVSFEDYLICSVQQSQNIRWKDNSLNL